MLNMSIILFRYKQFASKIYNAISMYYFLCKLITNLQNSIHFITWLLLYELKLTVVQLKKCTAQWFRSAYSARIFINMSWYERKSYTQKFGSVRVGKKFLVWSFPSDNEIARVATKSHVLKIARVATKSYVLRNSTRDSEITCVAKKSHVIKKSHALQRNRTCYEIARVATKSDVTTK